MIDTMRHCPVQFGQNDVDLPLHEGRRTFATALGEAKRAGNTCSPSCSYPSDTFRCRSIPVRQERKRLCVRDQFPGFLALGIKRLVLLGGLRYRRWVLIDPRWG